MSVDDFVKIILTFAVSISLVGICIQIMRLLGSLNNIIQDFRGIGKTAVRLVEQIHLDYKNLVENIKKLSEPIDHINHKFVQPLALLLGTVGKFATILNKKIGKNS